MNEACELCEINEATEMTRCGLSVCMDCKLAHQFEGCAECEHDEELEHGDILHDREVLGEWRARYSK